MRVYRITKAAFPSLDGEGARLHGGRWNQKGVAMVYLATSASLALLENLVNYDAGDLPDDLVLITVEIPDDIKPERLGELPDDWNSPAETTGCRSVGTAWVRSMRSALLLVPSVVVPMEDNILLNPAHPDAARIGVVKVEPFPFDSRFRSS